MERISKILFVISCLLAVFVYGIVVGFYKVFPFELITRVYTSAWSVAGHWETALRLRPTEFLHPARHDGQGVTVNVPGKAVPGLTFMSGFFDGGTELRLIRLDGSIVQRWPVRFWQIWPDPRHIQPPEQVPKTDWNTEIHGALIQPDGSVVFNFEYKGLVKLDRCGDVEWTVDHMTHHSVEPAADGGFWVSDRRYVTTESALPPLQVPYREDFILKISADGTVVDEISVPALLYGSDLRPMFFATGEDRIGIPGSNLVHLNDIEELIPAIADQFPMFAAGDLVLSMRDRNLVIVIDPENQEIKWHQVGPWIHQHDPDFLPSGMISVFNNNTDNTKTGTIFGGSSIVLIDPESRKYEIYYQSSDFYTGVRGRHQLLPDGNLLITEYEAGRVFEIDSSREIVWEFINRYDDDQVAGITQAERYPDNYFINDDWAC